MFEDLKVKVNVNVDLYLYFKQFSFIKKQSLTVNSKDFRSLLFNGKHSKPHSSIERHLLLTLFTNDFFMGLSLHFPENVSKKSRNPDGYFSW